MFKDETDFETIVGRLDIDVTPNPEHRERLRRETLSVFDETRQPSATRTTAYKNIRIRIMKAMTPKLAAAIMFTIAALVCAYQFLKPSGIVTVEVAKHVNDDSTGPMQVPIKIELPKAMFVGTPQDMKVENLEKPLGKPRPPFLAPEGTRNVAVGQSISGSDQEPIIGELEMITDGDKEAADGSYVELGPFVQHVTIDLEAEYNIYAIVIWHYHKQARVYFDVVVQVADDADFISNVKTLFNNDMDNSAGLGAGQDLHYTETNEGKLIDAKGIKARYIRLYSNGNTSNDLNHYIEVEVYGKPVQ